MSSASVPEPMPDPNPGFEVVPTVEVWEDGDRMAWWIRLNLALVGVGLLAVFTVGACLHPYDGDGGPRRMETHRQLGLPPCTFLATTGLPCPSCGFTTSFSLVAHLDLVNALRANSVGALLAVYCLAVIPWVLVSAWRGRIVVIQSVERFLITSLIGFVVLMLTRWGIILAVVKIEGRF